MSDKILFVDDDPNLLASCRRTLYRQFEVETAEGAAAGLTTLAERGPFAVVVADRQMPLMDGIQFLATVKQRAPDTVRIMLSGNFDLEAAIRVVNEGSIFRFLTKPCPVEILSKTLADACAQYRLVTAEKDLFNKTLGGSVKALTDILSIVDAESVGRTQTLRDIVSHLTEELRLVDAWEINLAIMLAPIGFIAVPPNTAARARSGQPLSKIEEQMVARVPETAARLLANIPRLEGVAKMVRHQQKHFDGTGFPHDSVSGEAIPIGGRLLKIFLDLVQLERSGLLRSGALSQMDGRRGWYDPRLLGLVRGCSGRLGTRSVEVAKRTIAVTVEDLVPGMVLCSNVETKDESRTRGQLARSMLLHANVESNGTIILVPAGLQINEMTLERIHNFERIFGIKEPILVEAPAPMDCVGSRQTEPGESPRSRLMMHRKPR